MHKAWNDFVSGKKVEYPDLEQWEQWNREIRTEVGGLAAGFRSEMVLRGYEMTQKGTGVLSFIQAWTLAITGRLPDKNEDRMLNALIVNTAMPDKRFWMFKTATLGATVKSSPAACIGAGIATKDGALFSNGPCYDTGVIFQEILKKVESGTSLEKIVKDKIAKKSVIRGFGRVLARGHDERVPPLLRTAKECGLDRGKYLTQAYEIEALLQKNKHPDLHINHLGFATGILMDMGFSPLQAMIYHSVMLIIGMAGNVQEVYESPPGEFMPLSNDDIEYTGLPLRPLPPISDKQTIVHQSEKGRITAMDSVTFIEKANRGDVIVCGSHGGIPSAEYALSFHPKGIIFNDAGMGKENAGIEGLNILDKANIPASAAAADSAKIGDGMDTYHNGVVSAFNDIAYKKGVRERMLVKEALLKML